MPTGYTAGIEDGTITTLREFALTCARAMGACVMQREEPLSNPPRPREQSAYYSEHLAKAEADLKELQSMSLDEAGRRSDADHAEAIFHYRQASDESFNIRTNYKTMRRKVEEWIVPSKDHEGLKKFMLEQIDLCTGSLYDADSPKRLSAQEWLDKKREKAAWDIGHYKSEIIKEKERCERSNAWLDQLKASLI